MDSQTPGGPELTCGGAGGPASDPGPPRLHPSLPGGLVHRDVDSQPVWPSSPVPLNTELPTGPPLV